MEAIVGLQSIAAGTIEVVGRAVVSGDTRELITSNRIGYIPPDRNSGRAHRPDVGGR